MKNLQVVKKKPTATTLIYRSIVPAQPSEILEIVSILIDGFPTKQADEQALINLAKAYVMAVDEWPLEAVRLAATAFIKGNVKGVSSSFLPTCADLAKETRLQFWRIEHGKRKGADNV